jgi:L-alanine-DL-glutamate epimerase-like enolase superfamily enzyme
MAAEYGKLCVPHSANHSLVTVFTLHLWNAMSNHGPFMEFSIEDQEPFRHMFTPALEVVDGKVAIPNEGYGWGVTIQEDWLQAAEYQVSNL